MCTRKGRGKRRRRERYARVDKEEDWRERDDIGENGDKLSNP